MLIQIREPDEAPVTPAVVAAGIDLGTTHTVVAWCPRGQKAQVLALESADDAADDAHLSFLVPSALAHTRDGEQIGRKALGASHPVLSVKRLMGRAVNQTSPEEQKKYALRGTPGDPGTLRVHTGSAWLSPAEISARILAHVRHKAGLCLGQGMTHAVITVPAHFDDLARQATRDAARQAGLSVLRLLNEPTAAALAYGLDQAMQGLFVVYDLGGGTFDLSVLRLDEGVFRVVATGGDTTLGGDDLDAALLDFWHKQAGHPDLNPEDRARLLLEVRKARHHLSDHETVTCPLVWPGQEPRIHTCDRATLDVLTKPWVQKTLAVCRQVLRDSALDRGDLQGVVLVGGVTRTPAVRQAVAEFFGCPVHQNLDPDAVVAMGAALQADRLVHGSDMLLLDVTPLSLGVETLGKLVDVVIPRNSPVPVRHTQWYTTCRDHQEAMAIHIVQGESESVDHCRSLGSFELRGIPPMPAGKARIQVAFDVDTDGLLTVTAREQTTGQEQTIHTRPSEGLSFESVVHLLQQPQP